MLEHSSGPFYPSFSNRWPGQDTCQAAGSRRLRAALRTGSTVSDQIRPPNILGPVCSFPRPKKGFFLDTFQSIRRTELPISASHPWPRNLSRRLLSILGCFFFFFSGLPSAQISSCPRTSAPGLGAYENVTQLIARSCC